MFDGLKNKHHLRHYARLQLGLFLKGAGLIYEEAMAFWKREFTKSMPVDKFQKQYAYNIQHNYGKQGKGVSYSAEGCIKIQNGANPGAAIFIRNKVKREG